MLLHVIKQLYLVVSGCQGAIVSVLDTQILLGKLVLIMHSIRKIIYVLYVKSIC